MEKKSSLTKDEIEYFELLPDELLELILLDLPQSKDISSFSRTQKRIYDISKHGKKDIIKDKYDKEIEELLVEYFLQHRSEMKLKDITPKMIMEIGLMNNNLKLIREAMRRGEMLTPKLLFELQNYMTDYSLEGKYKMIIELLKYKELDEDYLIYLFDMIKSQMGKVLLIQNNRIENLMKIAGLLIDRGICIRDSRYLDKFKITNLRDINQIKFMMRLNELVAKAICQ